MSNKYKDLPVVEVKRIGLTYGKDIAEHSKDGPYVAKFLDLEIPVLQEVDSSIANKMVALAKEQQKAGLEIEMPEKLTEENLFDQTRSLYEVRRDKEEQDMPPVSFEHLGRQIDRELAEEKAKQGPAQETASEALQKIGRQIDSEIAKKPSPALDLAVQANKAR